MMFREYIRSHLKSVAMFCLFAAVLAFLAVVFRIPYQILLYAAAICVFIGAVFTFFDYQSYLRRHEYLRKLLHEITDTADNLPAPQNMTEADYQEIVRALFAEKSRIAGQSGARYDSMIEYYTVWAHQIKTPIAALRLMLQGEDSEVSREMFGEVLRIEQYVEMVLCYLRLDSSSTDYVIAEYPLDGIIRQAVKKFASQFIRRRINLDFQPTELTVLTDEKWLLFVIGQVLSNALKYTASGSVTIRMIGKTTLSVRDTGIGIAPEDLPRIFEKGFTGYNGRADKKSTGIGLYLCRRITDRLGHTITARTPDGGGTEILIGFERADIEIE